MKRTRNKGLFITFEGGEGVGKTTLIDQVYDELINNGCSVIRTREPGGTDLGVQIRKFLLDKHDTPIFSRSELFLFLADRSQHVEEVILPALENNQIVLCDRFTDSTYAYQGEAYRFAFKTFKSICALAAHDLVPDLTLFLDLDPAIGLKRSKEAFKIHDRFEEKKLAYHKKVREAFLYFSKEENERFHVIDANHSPDEVFQCAIDEVNTKLEAHVANK